MAQDHPTVPVVAPAPPIAYMRLMVASVLGMVMFGAVQVALPVCLDALGTDLGLNFEQRGALVALRMAALTACLLAVGYFGERSGKQHVLFWGIGVIAASQVLIARAPDYRQLQVAMVVAGLGFGVFEALVNPLVAQLHPRSSAKALNIINGLFSVGLVAGALSTGELLQAGYSWRLGFWYWAVPPMVCALLYMTRRYPPLPVQMHDRTQTQEIKRFLCTPLFWVLVGCMILGGGCEGGLTSWAANFVSEELDASARAGALTTILYGAFMAIGRFAAGSLVSRIRPVTLMIVSAVLCGAATWALAFAPTLGVTYVLFSLGGLFVACFWPTLLAVASDSISRGSTTLFSLLGAAGVAGCTLVPWAIGALGDIVGLRGAVMVLPAVLAGLVVLLTVAARMVRQEHIAPSAAPDAPER